MITQNPKQPIEIHPALKQHKHFLHGKTWKHIEALKNIFQNRTNAGLGLTKNEVIALYQRISIKDVLNMRESSRDAIWHEVQITRKIIRREGIMAIVSVILPRGAVLNDNTFGRRTLGDSTSIYHKCVDMATAVQVRARVEKIAEGCVKSGDEVVEIAEEEMSGEKKVIEVMAGRNQAQVTNYDETAVEPLGRTTMKFKKVADESPKPRRKYGSIAKLSPEERKEHQREYMRKYMNKYQAKIRAQA